MVGTKMMKKPAMKLAGALSAVLLIAGCATTADDDTTGFVDPTPPTTSTAPVGPIPGSQSDLEQSAGHRVFFGYDEYNLTSQARATLERQASWLKQYPETSILIAGNCDERGTREYNLALGSRRAAAAKTYLTGLGIDPARIETVSYGKERPIDPRSTEAAWSLNRNATTTIVGANS